MSSARISIKVRALVLSVAVSAAVVGGAVATADQVSSAGHSLIAAKGGQGQGEKGGHSLG